MDQARHRPLVEKMNIPAGIYRGQRRKNFGGLVAHRQEVLDGLFAPAFQDQFRRSTRSSVE